MNFKQGDIIFLDFDPQAGHEQSGKRPAIVVSNDDFNKFTRLTMVCPITSTKRGFPTHIEFDNRTKTQGVILCEQVKALDLSKRNAHFLEKAPPDIIGDTVDMVFSFIEI